MYLHVTIADRNHERAETMLRCLSDDPDLRVVGMAANEADLLTILMEQQTDILIIGQLPSETTPSEITFHLSQAAHLQMAGKLKIVIRISFFESRPFLNAYSFTADYLLLMPVKASELARCVKQIAADFHLPYTFERVDQTAQIASILNQIGMPAHLLGYAYLLTGLQACLDDASYLKQITKRLYPFIADVHHSTPCKVERSIRNAIEVTFARGNTALLEAIFGYSIHPVKGKPTNSECIAQLTNYLRLQETKRTFMPYGLESAAATIHSQFHFGRQTDSVR